MKYFFTDSKANIRARASNWRLVAQTAAAKNKKNLIALIYGKNKVGKRKENNIVLQSTRCSRTHCTIDVDDTIEEIRLVDEVCLNIFDVYNLFSLT